MVNGQSAGLVEDEDIQVGSMQDLPLIVHMEALSPQPGLYDPPLDKQSSQIQRLHAVKLQYEQLLQYSSGCIGMLDHPWNQDQYVNAVDCS